MGPRDSPLFATDLYWKPAGTHKKFPFPIGSFKTNLSQGEYNCNLAEEVQIQIVDQPGSLNPQQFGEFLKNCIVQINKSDFRTFLILTNLNIGVFSHEEFSKMKEISLILKRIQSNFFLNALLVFTYFDELDEYSEKSPGRRIKSLINQETYSNLRTLIESTQYDPIFINAVNFSSKNRAAVLQKVLYPTFSKQTSSINKNDIGDIISNTLKELSNCINTINGIILINLQEFFQEDCDEVLKSSEIFKDKSEHEHCDFWKNICIVFKGMHAEETEEIREKYDTIQGLIQKVDNRYIYINKAEDCSKRIHEHHEKWFTRSCSDEIHATKSDITKKADHQRSTNIKDPLVNGGREEKEKKSHREVHCDKLNYEVLISSNMLFRSEHSDIPPFSYFILAKTPNSN